jgi:hypothetical protein
MSKRLKIKIEQQEALIDTQDRFIAIQEDIIDALKHKVALMESRWPEFGENGGAEDSVLSMIPNDLNMSTGG